MHFSLIFSGRSSRFGMMGTVGKPGLMKQFKREGEIPDAR